MHSGIKINTCLDCNKTFSLSVHLKRHLMTHSGIKMYTCADCDKTFSQSGNLFYDETRSELMIVYQHICLWTIVSSFNVVLTDMLVVKGKDGSMTVLPFEAVILVPHGSLGWLTRMTEKEKKKRRAGFGKKISARGIRKNFSVGGIQENIFGRPAGFGK